MKMINVGGRWQVDPSTGRMQPRPAPAFRDEGYAIEVQRTSQEGASAWKRWDKQGQSRAGTIGGKGRNEIRYRNYQTAGSDAQAIVASERLRARVVCVITHRVMADYRIGDIPPAKPRPVVEVG